MRSWLLVGLGGLWVPALALVSAAPPQAVLDSIQMEIYAARRMDLDVTVAAQAVEAAKALQRSPSEIWRLEGELRKSTTQQQRAFAKALHRLRLAYDIAPPKLPGRSVMPWTEDSEVEWNVRVGEREFRKVKDARGRSKRVPQPKGEFEGLTYYDGVTYISRRALDRGVAHVASTMLHERIHFDQYTTKGRGDELSEAERQLEAFQAEWDNRAVFFDPVRDRGLIGQLETKLEETRAEVRELHRRRGTVLGWLRWKLAPPREDPFDFRPHRQDELAAIRASAAQIRAEVERENLERERRDWEARFSPSPAGIGRGPEDSDPCAGLPPWQVSACLARRLSEHNLATTPQVAAPPSGDRASTAARAAPVPFPTHESPNAAAMPTAMPAQAPPVSAEFVSNFFARLSARACSEPDSVTQEELDRLWWFPSRTPATAGTRTPVSVCERELYFALMGLNWTAPARSRLGADWLASEARRLSERRAARDDSSDDGPRERGREPLDYNRCIHSRCIRW